MKFIPPKDPAERIRMYEAMLQKLVEARPRQEEGLEKVTHEVARLLNEKQDPRKAYAIKKRLHQQILCADDQKRRLEEAIICCGFLTS